MLLKGNCAIGIMVLDTVMCGCTGALLQKVDTSGQTTGLQAIVYSKSQVALNKNIIETSFKFLSTKHSHEPTNKAE